MIGRVLGSQVCGVYCIVKSAVIVVKWSLVIVVKWSLVTVTGMCLANNHD